MAGVILMVKQVMKHLANGAGESLAKNAPTFFILAAMAVVMQWMNHQSVQYVTTANTAALEKAVDRLVASNTETLAAIHQGQTRIIENQFRIITNTEANTRAISDNNNVLKEQLDTSKETLTILKTKG